MKVVILDDTKSDAEILLKYIVKFQVERNNTIQADVYEASFDFLEEYNSQYDIIFLDIEMPGSDGLKVANEIYNYLLAKGYVKKILYIQRVPCGILQSLGRCEDKSLLSSLQTGRIRYMA